MNYKCYKKLTALKGGVLNPTANKLTQRHSAHKEHGGREERDMRSEVCSLNVAYTNKFDTTMPYSFLRASVSSVPPCEVFKKNTFSTGSGGIQFLVWASGR
jgi:hypothetical protein